MNQFCECVNEGNEGYCARYGRPMTGRFRQICAGVDVDLGTAAAFRAQWAREAGGRTPDYDHNICDWTADGRTRSCNECGSDTSHLVSCSRFKWINKLNAPTALLLKTDQAPGDAVAMTAAIYSLHRAHPGKYLTAVESPYPEVFDHNPDVVDVASIPGALPLHMHYPAIHQSNQRGIHFMQAWCEHLSSALGVDVPLMTNRPRLFFKESAAPPVGDYWVVCSGGKRDLTNKMWGRLNYQKVTAMLAKEIRFLQVGDASDDHPRLNGTNLSDWVGFTNLRELFDIVRRARGVLCGVSLLMHVTAALEKPAIVIAGGREPVAWNAYPKQQYLHTIGMLGCSSPQGDVGGACWRSRTVALGDSAVLDEHLCERPIDGTPECMSMIDPARVAELVLQYNRQYEV